MAEYYLFNARTKKMWGTISVNPREFDLGPYVITKEYIAQLLRCELKTYALDYYYDSHTSSNSLDEIIELVVNSLADIARLDDWWCYDAETKKAYTLLELIND